MSDQQRTTTMDANSIIDQLRAEQIARPAQPLVRRPTGSMTQAEAPPEPRMPLISVGFSNLQSFEFTQRVARALATSTMVPLQYRMMVPAPRGSDNALQENPNAIPNCIVALSFADKLRIDVLTVMQSLVIIEGRPSWLSQFLIATINGSGQFGRLRFRFTQKGKKTIDHVVVDWEGPSGSRRRVERVTKVEIDDVSCVAWGKDPEGEVIEGPEVSIELAVKEGWYSRGGSKWQTMPDMMLRYRAAAFFARTNCPELTMGLRTLEEESDVIEATIGENDTWVMQGDPVTETAEDEKPTVTAETKREEPPKQHTNGEQQQETKAADKPAETVRTEPATTKTQPRQGALDSLIQNDGPQPWWTMTRLPRTLSELAQRSGVTDLIEAVQKPKEFWMGLGRVRESTVDALMDQLTQLYGTQVHDKAVAKANQGEQEPAGQAQTTTPYDAHGETDSQQSGPAPVHGMHKPMDAEVDEAEQGWGDAE